MGPHATASFGEGSAIDIEDDQDGVTNNSHVRESIDLNATTQQASKNDSRAGRASRGYGRATLLECLDKLWERRTPVVPVASAWGWGK